MLSLKSCALSRRLLYFTKVYIKHATVLNACAATVAEAAPITPQRKTFINRRSKPTFKTVDTNRKIRGVTESPTLRKTEQIKL